MAVVRALAVLQIKLVGKTFLGVILRTDVFFLIRTIRPGALARVMNPADKIIVVRLFSHPRQIRRERSALLLIAFTHGMARQAPA